MLCNLECPLWVVISARFDPQSPSPVAAPLDDEEPETAPGQVSHIPPETAGPRSPASLTNRAASIHFTLNYGICFCRCHFLFHGPLTLALLGASAKERWDGRKAGGERGRCSAAPERLRRTQPESPGGLWGQSQKHPSDPRDALTSDDVRKMS